MAFEPNKIQLNKIANTSQASGKNSHIVLGTKDILKVPWLPRGKFLFLHFASHRTPYAHSIPTFEMAYSVWLCATAIQRLLKGIWEEVVDTCIVGEKKLKYIHSNLHFFH